MKKIFILPILYLFFSATVTAQVTDPQKIIKLEPAAHFISELNLEPGKTYGFLAKDLQELFPSLVKEKRINERFGKNAYRTKVIKIIDEKALVPVMASAIKKQNIAVQDLKGLLITIEEKKSN